MQIIEKITARILIFVIIFALFTTNLPIAFSNTGQDISMNKVIPDTKLVIWGKAYNNLNLKYPVLLIDGVFYYPLTKEFSQLLGYALIQTNNNDLVFTKRSSIGKSMITNLSIGTPVITSSSTPILRDHPTRLSGYGLYSEKPIYSIADVAYVALEFTPVLRSKINYSSKTGIEILTETTYLNNFPASYNTYDTIDKNDFVRDQGSAASCWSFAANTLFELAVQKKYKETVNFSESHLIENTPIKSTYESGGNFQASSIYYLNHKGPVLENQARSGNLDDKLIIPYQLDSYIEINDDINRIKENIIKNGAVLTSIYLNESDTTIYNKETYAYYNRYENKERTHELVLVGWDDQYNKDKFVETPAHNGAFIAQNSFGNSWGDNGFFYISYDDVHIMDYVYALDDLSKTSKSNGDSDYYYYDTTGVTHFENYNDDNLVTGVNVFKVKSNSILDKVGIYNNENDIHISIYAGIGQFPMTLSNKPLYETIIHDKGFHSLELPVFISLKKDQYFWVGVKYEGKQNFLLPIEASYPGMGYEVFAAPRQGYIGSEIDFTDLTEIRSDGSVAIRAFATPIR